MGVFDGNAQRFNLAPFCVTCTHGGASCGCHHNVAMLGPTSRTREHQKHTRDTAPRTRVNWALPGSSLWHFLAPPFARRRKDGRCMALPRARSPVAWADSRAPLSTSTRHKPRFCDDLFASLRRSPKSNRPPAWVGHGRRVRGSREEKGGAPWRSFIVFKNMRHAARVQLRKIPNRTAPAIPTSPGSPESRVLQDT